MVDEQERGKTGVRPGQCPKMQDKQPRTDEWGSIPATLTGSYPLEKS